MKKNGLLERSFVTRYLDSWREGEYPERLPPAGMSPIDAGWSSFL